MLLLKLKPSRGGYWQPVTGGVDEDEELETAALREAREETGLKFKTLPEPLDYHFRFYSARHESECEEHVFALHAPAKADAVELDPHEHVESRWVSARLAGPELEHPSNLEGLKRLIAAHGGEK